MYAPRTLGEFAQLVSMSDVVAWRGQSRMWRLDSGIARRLRNFGRVWENRSGRQSSPLELDYGDEHLTHAVHIFEEKLVNEARLAGLDFRNGRFLNTLELIAALQHHGAATRLVDFTRNAFLALWFAAVQDPAASHADDMGVVIGVRASRTHWLSAEEVRTAKSIREVADAHSDFLVAWRPSALFERIRAQQSVHLFSQIRTRVWGSLDSAPYDDQEQDNFANNYYAIAVTHDLKLHLSGIWNGTFGYDVSSVFPEIDGFSRAHAATEFLPQRMFEAVLECVRGGPSGPPAP